MVVIFHEVQRKFDIKHNSLWVIVHNTKRYHKPPLLIAQPIVDMILYMQLIILIYVAHAHIVFTNYVQAVKGCIYLFTLFIMPQFSFFLRPLDIITSIWENLDWLVVLKWYHN